MKILIICLGNSCRSQMAEGFMRYYADKWEIASAGTKPEKIISSRAVKVMAEVGIDITNHCPKSIDRFLGQDFDYVITVCDKAKETCPQFSGNIGERLHIGLEDPWEAKGTEEEILDVYRKVRDKIKTAFQALIEQKKG